MQVCTCEGALGSFREHLCVSEHMLSEWAEAAHTVPAGMREHHGFFFSLSMFRPPALHLGEGLWKAKELVSPQL